MAESRRFLLQNQLETLLGLDHVYFNPPESISLVYPCLIYTLSNKLVNSADDKMYKKMDRYELTYIHIDPDDLFVDSLLSNFNYIKFDRQAIVKNVYNDYLILYF